MSEAVRWNIKVSKETDLSLRHFLGARGMRKGDLSKFIEEAVRWRLLEQTVSDIKDKNQDLSPAQMEQAIEEALDEVRTEMRMQSLPS